MQRMYEPHSGQILLDSRALQRTDVHHLRDHIAVVSQHPALFDMSVHENIGYGTEASKEDVQDAARLASAHDFILQRPPAKKQHPRTSRALDRILPMMAACTTRINTNN